ncbi:MAG TPA: hypothetical protein PLS84_03675 [Salinivirgaceae bacterium]|nr:hypothetical protein [Salinivirgaceae bacterium]HQB68981.1 hypothetical protein [Paludibacteraceae bacterium]
MIIKKENQLFITEDELKNVIVLCTDNNNIGSNVLTAYKAQLSSKKLPNEELEAILKRFYDLVNYQL